VTPLDETEAHALADRINRFWRLNGYIHVTAWPERVIPQNKFDSGPTIWGVRSNLVAGLPPGVGGDEVARLYRPERRFG
jgi:hypothetical protein